MPDPWHRNCQYPWENRCFKGEWFRKDFLNPLEFTRKNKQVTGKRPKRHGN